MMEKIEATLDLKLNSSLLELGIKGAKTALSGLSRVLKSIGESIQKAFSIKGFTDYTETVSRFGKALADDLLVLQLNFGKLKAAIADAAAPIAAVLVPWLNAAVRKATELAGTAAGVFQAVLGNRAVAESANEAAKAETKLASAGRAVRRSLMDIDQIQRLNAPTGSSSITQTTAADPYTPGLISEKAQAIADRIKALLEPLQAIDFSPLMGALEQLKTAFQAVAAVAGQALNGLWYQVMTPFFTWVAEQFAPAFTKLWAAAMNTASVALQPVMTGLQNLWTALQPVVAYIGDSVVSALGLWRAAFEKLGTVFAVCSPQITGVLTNIGTVLSQVWDLVSPILETLRQRFSATFSQVSTTVATAVSGILQALYGVSEYLAGVFTGDWQRVWEGLKTWFAGLVNGLIGLLNGLLTRLGSALNSVISAANRLHFTVPDWVPGLGGASFGVNMAPVSVPQIPYLAKGAVLPANKPFLAMVGDQKSGTNVETPLATIQEAVRAEMADMVSGMMAGVEASVGVQKEILEAVLGIQIGDDVIGSAAARYERKRAVARGGAV